MFAEINEAGIKKLVDVFYDKIRQDEELGPVFNSAIPANAWPSHLKKLCDFWSAVMLKTERYGGNPLRKHTELPPFPPEMFGRWLELFSDTAREVFEPLPASRFVDASENIAFAIKRRMFAEKTLVS